MITLIDKLNNRIMHDGYFLDENKEILIEKIKTSALNMDDHLMTILLSDEEFTNAFFIKKNGILIFDKVKFSWIISNSNFLPDSYTSYKNKIGLVDTDSIFLKRKNDVLLSFPFKDCVLEFDSTSEEDNRNEVFLNEYLAKDYIDTLFSPKVFHNANLHNSTGSTSINEYVDQSLLIKGNNLVAMHSLKKKFNNIIKLMYWDILYNTSSDSVPYNDSFKHSSWLTMMKNRLEVAKDLLSDKGIIMIHLDANEMAYLKVLMDEIFDRKNYLGMFTCKVKAPSGVASGAQMIFDCSEYILVYSKDVDKVTYNHLLEETEVVDEKSKTASFYKYILEHVSYDDKELVKDLGNEKVYRIKKKDFSIKTMSDQSAFAYYQNYKNVFRTAALSGGREKEIAKIVSEQQDALESLFVFEHIPSKGKRAGQLCLDLIYKNGGVLMLSDFCKVDDTNKQIIKMQHITSIFANDWWQGISKEGDITLKNGKKPEILLKTLIEMATNPGDIVLDAYFGTGTTGAVAMKLDRKFIGIEQLKSHFDKAIHRLDGVISGDKSGVSREVKWNGGGEFVAVELSKENYKIIDKLSRLDENETNDIYDWIINNPYCLNYKIDSNLLSNARNREEFLKLSLDDKKKIMVEVLDKNSLYVNYSEIEDEEKGVSDVDKAFTKSFYGE